MKFKTVLGTWLLGIFALSGTAIAKESGEKGGTEDINIGVGELQEDKERPKKKKGAKPVTKVEKSQFKKAKKKKKPAARPSPALDKRAARLKLVLPVSGSEEEEFNIGEFFLDMAPREE